MLLNDRCWRILLQKSFLDDKRKFSEPLLHFARSDVGDHIVSSKIDHGPSQRRCKVVPSRRHPKINFRQIFGAGRFYTFAKIGNKSNTIQSLRRRSGETIRGLKDPRPRGPQTTRHRRSSMQRRNRMMINCTAQCTCGDRTLTGARLLRLFKPGFEKPVQGNSPLVAESGARCNDLGGRWHTGELR